VKARSIDALPFVPAVVGIAISILRFRAGDPVGGLAGSLAGVLLMAVVASLLRSERSP